jgi:amino acid transporter
VFLLVLVSAAPSLGPLGKAASPLGDIIIYVLGSVVSRIFLAIVVYAVFCCGLSVFLDETRVVFAMSRDNRLPGHALWKRIHPRFNTPLWATVGILVLLEALLAVFARDTNTLFALIGAASIFPPIVYGFPCLIALFRRHKLPENEGWSLGKWELPVIIASLVWACLAILVLRDHSLWGGWRYAGGGTAIGLVYLGYLKVKGRLTELPAFSREDDVEVGATADPP